MKLIKILCVTSMLVPLSGCLLWSDFEKPDTDKPEQWQNQKAASAWPDTNWWTQFNSPELTAQIQEAQAANYDLKAAVARVRQADAQARIAGAALLPAIDATGDATRTKSSNGGLSNSGISGVSTRGGSIRNSVTAELSASYELDFWGKNWATAEAASELADASRYDWEVVNLTTLSSVADTYFDILATQARLQIARDNLKAAQDLLSAFQLRFKVGTATALDVAQQASVVATQGAAVPPLELQLQQDLDAQAILLGKLPENIQAPQQKITDMKIPVVGAGIPSELLERRPDVQEAEADLSSAHANIIVARAQFFPSISLTADGGYASNTLSHLFDPGSRLFSIGADLTQPIFEGGQLEGNLELSKARYDELLANYRKAVVSAFADVENSLVAVQKDDDQEKAQKNLVDTAQTAFELTEKQFKGGVVDITTVLNTQRTLFSAQDAYAQAQVTHLEAIVGLYKALGGGWQKTPPSDVSSQQTPMPSGQQTPVPDAISQTPKPGALPLIDSAPDTAPAAAEPAAETK